ncbi:hypothetical protein HYU19_05080 [Candidatus Woesearchaeota archaeon]|nr:hypothetical protein [Candidatus Woesearchaeota archaeon]
MIKKIKGLYRVLSESGRNMGTYPTLKAAKKRLQQIEYFKHVNGKMKRRKKGKR